MKFACEMNQTKQVAMAAVGCMVTRREIEAAIQKVLATVTATVFFP